MSSSSSFCEAVGMKAVPLGEVERGAMREGEGAEGGRGRGAEVEVEAAEGSAGWGLLWVGEGGREESGVAHSRSAAE